MAIEPSDVLLDGRVAVVTGGGSGHRARHRRRPRRVRRLGRHLGADPETCAAAAAQIGALGLATDVRDSDAVDAALARTTEELGPVTILVNNAGGVFPSPILETTENGWDALYRANLRHVLLCTQRVARGMVDAGIGGSITTVTSIEGVRAAPGYAAYAAAKAGVINYTKTAALELAPHGIRVNALAPDITMTEGIRALAPAGSEERFGDTVPMGRAGHVDEMAGAAVFLASDLSSYVTGQTIHVDGGTHAAGGWYHHPRDRRVLTRTDRLSNGDTPRPTISSVAPQARADPLRPRPHVGERGGPGVPRHGRPLRGGRRPGTRPRRHRRLASHDHERERDADRRARVAAAVPSSTVEAIAIGDVPVSS